MNRSHTALFYGTLMHPKILTRVIGNDGSHLQLAPAILLDHTRHKVKCADYPGVIPFTLSERLFGSVLSEEDRCVRGMLVTGLTDLDIELLDVFEGSEYLRQEIQAHPLTEFRDITAHTVDESSLPQHPPPLPPRDDLPPPIPAETYIYVCDKDLEAELWSYEDFVRQNAWKWYTSTADHRPDIAEVDKLRAEHQRRQDKVVEMAPL
ncbi:hypothetical protein CPB83DRAFT_844578 [Crepidotus variabilis]|uniref:Putative gamma-glutamylcyclotransferase n=1 Tax=Crepidotus variabilis TaxID=179855 RepID=A0A9P6JVE7_9AGAR|nr:hypothetical protein CPB83DRAFT_844578 [Crepidotus variabilis]